MILASALARFIPWRRRAPPRGLHQSPDDARDIIDKKRFSRPTAGGSRPLWAAAVRLLDAKTFFDSLQIKQEGDRALLTALDG